MATTTTYITPMQVQTAPAMVLPPSRGLMNVGCVKGLAITELVIGLLTVILGAISLVLFPIAVLDYFNRKRKVMEFIFSKAARADVHYHAITQLVIGLITVILGIIILSTFNNQYRLTKSGTGLWAGFWFFITGMLGLASSLKPQNSSLNGCNMAFSIISTCISFLAGIFFVVGLSFYNVCHYNYQYRYDSTWGYNRFIYDDYDCKRDQISGRGVYGSLVFLMVVEFFISIIAAIYCCQATSCCCTGGTQGVVLQARPQPGYVVTGHPGQHQQIVQTSTPYASTGMMTTTHYNQPQQTVILPPYQQQQVAPPPPHGYSYPPPQPPPQGMGQSYNYVQHQQTVINGNEAPKEMPPPYVQ